MRDSLWVMNQVPCYNSALEFYLKHKHWGYFRATVILQSTLFIHFHYPLSPFQDHGGLELIPAYTGTLVNSRETPWTGLHTSPANTDLQTTQQFTVIFIALCDLESLACLWSKVGHQNTWVRAKWRWQSMQTPNIKRQDWESNLAPFCCEASRQLH